MNDITTLVVISRLLVSKKTPKVVPLRRKARIGNEQGHTRKPSTPKINMANFRRSRDSLSSGSDPVIVELLTLLRGTIISPTLIWLKKDLLSKIP